jgi:hypothetical protein
MKCSGYVAIGFESWSDDEPNAWLWGSLLNRSYDIIRYRIRKPRGLTILEGLLENLPESVDA